MKIIGTNPFLAAQNKNHGGVNSLSNNKLSKLSSDTVCFKENPISNTVKPNWIDKSLSDKIMALVCKYDFENLEFVDKNNDLRYSLNTIPRQGFIYVNEQKILDDRLEFFGTGVNYPSIKSQLAEEGESSESKTNQFIWEFGGKNFVEPYNGKRIEPEMLSFEATARKVEDVYRRILADVEAGEVTIHDGKTSQKYKTYDDFSMTRKKNSLRIAAYKLLMQQRTIEINQANSITGDSKNVKPLSTTERILNLAKTLIPNSQEANTPPTREEIDKIVQGFVKQRNLIDKNNARKKWQTTTPDEIKYAQALEKQRAKRQEALQMEATSQAPVEESPKELTNVLEKSNKFLERANTPSKITYEEKADKIDINTRLAPKPKERRRQAITKEDILFGTPMQPDSDKAKFYRAYRKQQAANDRSTSPKVNNTPDDDDPSNKPGKGKLLHLKQKKS